MSYLIHYIQVIWMDLLFNVGIYVALFVSLFLSGTGDWVG